MFPSFPRYKEGTGGRGQIEPGPPVVLNRDFPKLTSLSFSLRPSALRHVMYTIVDRYYMTMKERLGASLSNDSSSKCHGPS
jgi:hypothetical protein